MPLADCLMRDRLVNQHHFRKVKREKGKVKNHGGKEREKGKGKSEKSWGNGFFTFPFSLFTFPSLYFPHNFLYVQFLHFPLFSVGVKGTSLLKISQSFSFSSFMYSA